jgi:hypothetical protein
MGQLGNRTIRVGVTLGAIVGLVGCDEQAEDAQPSNEFALSSFNGLSGVNGLSGANGLSGVNGLSGANGLSAMNGLSGVNGLSGTNGFMTTDGGRKTVAYLVKCALAANDSLTKQDQNGVSYTFPGGLGLCPAWKNGGVASDPVCQEYMSACMMAHINTAGIHIPIWLDADAPTIGWGIDTTNFPFQEGSFFGNIMMTGSLAGVGMPTVNAPVAYYCDGDGFDQGSAGEVAGRLGAGQSSAPYLNPFAATASPLCKNSAGMVPQYSNGTAQGNPDGYKRLNANGTPWNHVITVWRNGTFTPVFDAGYSYLISSLLTRANPMVLDAASQTNGTPVTQWSKSSNLASSELKVVAVGANFKLVMKANSNKCIDAGTGAQGAALTVKDCNGSTAQTFSIVPLPKSYGTFLIKNVIGNRAITAAGTSTQQKASGTAMTVTDYGAWSSQQFRIEAKPLL